MLLFLALQWPSGTEKILIEVWIVWMNRSPIMPALKVQAISHAAEEILPFNTPCLKSALVSLALWAVCPAGISKLTCFCSRRRSLYCQARDGMWDIEHAVSVV